MVCSVLHHYTANEESSMNFENQPSDCLHLATKNCLVSVSGDDQQVIVPKLDVTKAQTNSRLFGTIFGTTVFE